MAEYQTYVSRKLCGCVGMMVVDDPGRRGDVSSMVASAIRHGETVERMETEQARRTPFRCPEHAPPKAERVVQEGLGV